MLRTLLVLSLLHFDSKFNLRLLCILSLYIIYDWITIMGHSNHDISTINMLYSYLPTTATSPQRPLSSVTKVAFVERFDSMFCIPWTYFSEFLVITWTLAFRRQIAAIFHYVASPEIALDFVIAQIVSTALMFHSFEQ